MSLVLPRRRLLAGIAAMIAAPAVVKASSLMPISGETYRIWRCSLPILPPLGEYEAAYEKGISYDEFAKPWLSPNGNLYEGTWTFFGKNRNIYSDKVIAFSKREMPRP